jgi:hypothetical protein
MRDFREGFWLVFTDPVRRMLVLLGWGSAVFLIAPEAVALAYARQDGLGELVGGALLASVPAGAAVGAVLVGRMPPHRQVRLVIPLAAAACLPLLATSIEPPSSVAFGLWFVAGLCQGFMVTLIATVNLVTPPDYRGRVNGLAGAGFAAATALSFLGTGWLADLTSPAVAVTMAGAVGLAVVWILHRLWPRAALHRAVDDACREPVTGA